jgi:hypothetical protein
MTPPRRATIRYMVYCYAQERGWDVTRQDVCDYLATKGYEITTLSLANITQRWSSRLRATCPGDFHKLAHSLGTFEAGKSAADEIRNGLYEESDE